MPNIKSSVRSVKTDAERRKANAPVKSELRSASRKTSELAANGAKEEAAASLVKASGLLDRAAHNGIIHKNAAARKKSRLAKKVNEAAK